MIDQPAVVGDGADDTALVIASQPSIRVVVMQPDTVLVRDTNSAPQVVQGGDSSIAIVERDIPSDVIKTGFPGPQGRQGDIGPPGGAPIQATALVNLTWPVVVTVRNGLAAPADPSSADDMQAQLAITYGAALAGQPVTLITLGQHSETGWNWNPGRVFLAPTGGGLTQTPDPTCALLEVGRAIDPKTIDFCIQPAILR